MTRQIPNYLRLHNAEDSVPKPRRKVQLDCVAEFWRTFADTTGWAIQQSGSANAVKLMSSVGAATLMSADELADAPTIGHDAALELANTAFRLAEQLERAEELIRSQEARLAAYEASAFSVESNHRVSNHSNLKEADKAQESASLSDRVNNVLRSGMRSIDACAAGLYTLDQDTKALKLRACVGLPTSKLAEPPRSLSDSLADLEALAGGIVVLEDCELLPAWNSPEPFAAGICVAVTVSGNPVGTLWLWSEDVHQFSDGNRAAATLTAQLVASELTSDTLSRRASKANRAIKPLKSAAAWQQRQQPVDRSPATGWSLSGWTDAPLALASSWFYWDILPDGMLALVIAEAHGHGYESAMIAATARSAWQAHCGYRHDPSQMLQRISDTLWQTNVGDQLLSCFYAQINPETGEGSMASAGVLSGIIMGRFGFRPLMDVSQPIGTNIDLRPRLHHLQVDNTESLYIYTPGLVDRMSDNPTGHFLNQHRLAEILRDSPNADATASLAVVRQAASKLGKAKQDRTILAAARK